MAYFFQLVVSGIVVGSIYALAALGFVLIYKSTSILNLAQGEFMMVGAYICLSMTLDFVLTTPGDWLGAQLVLNVDQPGADQEPICTGARTAPR